MIKKKLKQFTTSKQALQKLLKDILPKEDKDKSNPQNTEKNKPH
jgi:hypothetical protein